MTSRVARVAVMAALTVVWPAVSHAQGATNTVGHDHEQAAPEANASPETAGDAAGGLPPFVPPVTEEARQAAFPDVDGHPTSDNAVHSLLLFDQLEWQPGAGLSWDDKGWIGRDVGRFWFRTEGDSQNARIETAEAHLLYGRPIGRWWDLVAGVRQDVKPGPARTWAAVGVQGLAPYWFDVEATAYVGSGGRTLFRLETEYELLLTNRLIAQPLVEAEFAGKDDPERQIGAGLATADVGLRIRYEIRREFAPYVGVTWNRKFFGTADAARAAGENPGDSRLTLGLRFWL